MNVSVIYRQKQIVRECNFRSAILQRSHRINSARVRRRLNAIGREWRENMNLWIAAENGEGSRKSRRERAFRRRIARGVKAHKGRWAGITDSAAYVRELRGGE